MSDWQPVQLILVELPLWHELIHQGYEAGVMCRFKQMGHLVYDDIFETLRWFFCQVCIEADVL